MSFLNSRSQQSEVSRPTCRITVNTHCLFSLSTALSKHFMVVAKTELIYLMKWNWYTKSSIIYSYSYTCTPYNISCYTAAFLTQTVALDDATVKFEIWDTAGQERYRSLAPMYYRGAAAAIVVYDITNPDSFAGAKSWVKELQRRGDQNVVIAMVSTDPSFWSQWDIGFAIILTLYTL